MCTCEVIEHVCTCNDVMLLFLYMHMSQALLSFFNNEGEGLAHADLMTKTYQVCTQLVIGKGR